MSGNGNNDVPNPFLASPGNNAGKGSNIPASEIEAIFARVRKNPEAYETLSAGMVEAIRVKESGGDWLGVIEKAVSTAVGLLA